ncbi:MAG: Fe-Mn family superoxide dismutase [Candidatus Calescibacterium sp.]|nr:Fe-Mn family superoxide dismutase [Candidatus Calescibacterium sp.]MCX7734520.1 Fe-Mn family superoxide dismutase [bacterium]MDW8087655.1 Fe-Mn family superoxide dismutase [Candidatus Calescibacterium sp.]
MIYQAKNFENLIGTPGFSEQLLKNHFTLYQGYVTNTNKLYEIIQQMTKDGKAGTPEFAEIKRRFGWEFNGMRLHEYYFENMTKNKKDIDKGGKLHKKIQDDFGSFDNWQKEFKSTGAMRGIGWAIMYYDPFSKRLFNTWINEHDVGHLAGCPIILIMDVFEHAFMIDYGLKRADYIEAFFNAIDWDIVQKRYETAEK